VQKTDAPNGIFLLMILNAKRSFTQRMLRMLAIAKRWYICQCSQFWWKVSGNKFQMSYLIPLFWLRPELLSTATCYKF